MKREYFVMLFIIVFTCSLIALQYLVDEQIVNEYLTRFVVVWVLLAIYIGQYSMRFPKIF